MYPSSELTAGIHVSLPILGHRGDHATRFGVARLGQSRLNKELSICLLIRSIYLFINRVSRCYIKFENR